MHEVFRLWLILLITLNTAVSEDTQQEILKDQEILRKLKQKKLVTIVMSKPEDCSVLSENNDDLSVHYTGYLDTGGIFDSTENSEKNPITFTLGHRQVIRGWEEGLLNMCQGERRRLIIPPELGYGKTGFPPVIPPNAMLIFEVTLVKLRKGDFGSRLTDIEQLLQLVKFLLPPLIVLYVFYYLYGRYKAETQAAREQKHQTHGKNSRKKK